MERSRLQKWVDKMVRESASKVVMFKQKLNPWSSPAKTRKRSVRWEVQLQRPRATERKSFNQSLPSPRRTTDGGGGLPKPHEIG